MPGITEIAVTLMASGEMPLCVLLTDEMLQPNCLETCTLCATVAVKQEPGE